MGIYVAAKFSLEWTPQKIAIGIQEFMPSNVYNSEDAASYLRSFRQRNECSVAQVSYALGVPVETVLQWEKLEMPIEYPRILILALEGCERLYAMKDLPVPK